MLEPGYEYHGLVARSWDFLRGDPMEFIDREFLLEAANRFGQPILDVGCATGRLVLELRANGFDVEGLDVSPKMLELCQLRADKLSLDVNLYLQTMEAMDLPRKYLTILVPSYTFQLIPDLEDARMALSAFYQHLLPGGTLVLSVWSIQGGWTGEWRDWWLVAENDGFEGPLGLRRWERAMHDPLTQLRHTESRYELVEDGEVVYAELHRQSPEFRSYTLQQITEIMAEAGFEEIRATSGYTFDPVKEDDSVFCTIGVRR